jgi:hypothetical protein
MTPEQIARRTQRSYTSLAFCITMLSLNNYSKQIPKLYNGMGALSIVYNIDLKDQTLDYFIHHSMSLVLGGIITFNSYTFNNPEYPPEIFDSWINFEVSTLFLCLYYISNKRQEFKLPFLLSFVYYRFCKFIPANFTLQAREEIDDICTDHYILNHDPCVNMVNGITLGIIILNSMWLCLIIKKMNKQINFYNLRKYGIESIDKKKED